MHAQPHPAQLTHLPQRVPVHTTPLSVCSSPLTSPSSMCPSRRPAFLSPATFYYARLHRPHPPTPALTPSSGQVPSLLASTDLTLPPPHSQRPRPSLLALRPILACFHRQPSAQATSARLRLHGRTTLCHHIQHHGQARADRRRKGERRWVRKAKGGLERRWRGDENRRQEVRRDERRWEMVREGERR